MMDDSKIKIYRNVFFIFILFFATRISMDLIVQMPNSVNAIQNLQNKIEFNNIKNPKHKNKNIKSTQLNAHNQDKLDPEVFRSMFSKQISPSFISCLENHFTMSNELLLTSRLTKTGNLIDTKLVNLNASNEVPDCFSTEIKKMNFKLLTKDFQSSSVEVQWTIKF